MNPQAKNTKFSQSEPAEAYNQRYCGALLINKRGKVILQIRDDKPGIANPGMHTIFGGLQEAGESTIACVLRELQEEVTFTFAEGDLQLLGYFNKTEANGTKTMCTIFCVHDVDAAKIDLQEGQGIAELLPQEALASEKVSAVTKMAIRAAIADVI